MAKEIDPDKLNGFGLYVYENARGKPWAEIARRGGISDSTLGRWLKKDLANTPPPRIIQAVARALDVPPETVLLEAQRAAGQAPPSLLNDQQMSVVATMSDLDERWQHVVVDIVRRLAHEALRRET